jgi:hypothetical protein
MSRRQPRNWSAALTFAAIVLVIAAAYAFLGWWLINSGPQPAPAPTPTAEVTR